MKWSGLKVIDGKHETEGGVLVRSGCRWQMSGPKNEVGQVYRALEVLRQDIQGGTLWLRIDAAGASVALGKAAEMLRCVTVTDAECSACAGLPGADHEGCYLA